MISAVIITFNEARNIRRCLDSLQGIADEIIVVDSGSADDTEKICREYPVRFEYHAWEGYAAQKNYANSLATQPLILSMDADEALSPELAASIRNLNPEEAINGWEMNRLTNYCGSWIRHCGWYPDRKLRVFRKDKGAWDGAKMHERIVLNSGKTVLLKGDLLHYSYYSISDHIRQIELFSGLMAEMQHEQGKKAGILKLITSIPVRFFRDYFFKLGFLDGYHGFVICSLSAWASFVRCLKLRELMKSIKQK